MTDELFIIIYWLFIGYYSVFLVFHFAKLDSNDEISYKKMLLEPLKYSVLGPLISIRIIIICFIHLYNNFKKESG